MDHIYNSEPEWYSLSGKRHCEFHSFSSLSFISHFLQAGFPLPPFLESFWSPLFGVSGTADSPWMVLQPPPWQALCLAQASSFVIASCHWSLHLIPLTWNKFTNMPLISHCFIVQEAIIISWHLSHYELWIHNGIYEFFLAYPRSNLITLFFLICQQSLIIPTALLLPSQVINLCIKAAPFFFFF